VTEHAPDETVDKHLCARRSQQKDDPSDPPLAKSSLSKHAYEEGPRDIVKLLGDVDLEQLRGNTLAMQKPRGLFDEEEIVLYASSTDERSLVPIHKMWHSWG
jgi:hypothetical protein